MPQREDGWVRRHRIVRETSGIGFPPVGLDCRLSLREIRERRYFRGEAKHEAMLATHERYEARIGAKPIKG